MNRDSKNLQNVLLLVLIVSTGLLISSVQAEESGITDVEAGISLGGDTYTVTVDESGDLKFGTDSAEQEATQVEEDCSEETCETTECESSAQADADGNASKSGGLLSIFFGSSGENAEPEDDGSDFIATHEQVATLKVKPDPEDESSNSGWAVKSFCLDKDDNILVAAGGSEGELQLLDPHGELLRSWPLPVVPEALNVDADGNFLVAGAATIYKMSPEGEVLFQAESPLVAEMENNKEQMREQVIKQIKANAEMMINQRDMYERLINDTLINASKKLDHPESEEFKILLNRVTDFESREPTDLSLEEENAWALRKVLLRMLKVKVEKVASESDKQIIQAYTDQLAYVDDYMKENPAGTEPSDEQIEETLKSTIAYKSQFASISAAGSDVFIATGAMQGYGFSVWRFNDQLENAEQVVKQLSGCCGQMDVQCCEEGIFVAENSRHRVCHFDRDGKRISSWGKGAREGVRGFGGCCNPMNVAFGTDGTVYTAESESGRIKRFTPEGELLDLVGSVKLVPGCKKVSVAVSNDGKRVYMLDITRNHIIVMEAKQADQQIASK